MTIQQMLLASGSAGGATVQIEFRLYGAGGGYGSNWSNTGNSFAGGSGGYCQGTFLAVPVGTVFYIGVGQGGMQHTSGYATDPARYNGGARPGNGQYPGGSGGGASHITTFPHTTTLDGLSGLTSGIILVVGAGGGGGNCSRGGNGGGATGGTAPSPQFSGRAGGQGGTQTGGQHTYPGVSGIFGRGMASNQNLAGGGGGGWYGGGGGDNSTGGGGGSSYVSTNNHAGLGVLTNTANNASQGMGAGSNSEVLIYKNGSYHQTFYYTGSIQSYTVTE